MHAYSIVSLGVHELLAVRLMKLDESPPLTKEIRLKIFDPIISNSFPVRYYGISGTNLPDIP